MLQDMERACQQKSHSSVEYCVPSKDHKTLAAECRYWYEAADKQNRRPCRRAQGKVWMFVYSYDCLRESGLSIKTVTISLVICLSHRSPVNLLKQHWHRLAHQSPALDSMPLPSSDTQGVMGCYTCTSPRNTCSPLTITLSHTHIHTHCDLTWASPGTSSFVTAVPVDTWALNNICGSTPTTFIKEEDGVRSKRIHR